MAESTEWPDYEVPADGLADGADRTESRSASEPVEATPETEPPPTSATDERGTDTGAKPADDDSGDTVPRYRLNEVREAERRALAEREAFRVEAETLRREMAELQRGSRRDTPPAREPEPAALSDEDRKTALLRDGLFKVIPELRQLPDLIAALKQAGKWDEAAEATEAWRAAEKVFYDTHADTQLTRLYTFAAEAILGKGKAVDDLSKMTRDTLDNAFGRWVFADPERRARYDRLDTKLVDEFWPLYKAAQIDPLRRSDSAAVLASVAGRPKLPVGGSVTGAPPPAVTKKQPSQADEDEDAIFDRSWEIAKSEMSAKG